MTIAMNASVRENEIRIVIQPLSAPGFPPGELSAPVFKKIFDSFLAALVAADHEIHPRQTSSEFFLSHLSMAPSEFGFLEKQRGYRPGRISAIEFMKRCSIRVNRSDYKLLLRYQRLLRAFHRVVKALDPAYLVVVHYHDTELPMDDFFCSQLGRVGEPGSTAAPVGAWFAGVVLTSLQGRLEAIDYGGPVWRGRLALSGSNVQVECVFEKASGEDAFNQFGNKSVCISGRAIFTGDSQLPERVEVLKIEQTPQEGDVIDVNSALIRFGAKDWGDDVEQIL